MPYGKYKSHSRRLRHWDYSTPGGYFVTICTHLRKPFFGTIEDDEMNLSPIGEIIDQEWEKTAILREAVELDEYAIMPNHLHGIIMIKPLVETPQRGVSVSEDMKAVTLGTIISQFKSACTRRIQAVCKSNFAWQSRFYDHIIRDDIDLRRIRKYIQENPRKWELDKYYCRQVY